MGLHYTFVQGNRAYLSYHHAGMIILDITKKTNPKFISRLDYLLPPNGYTDTMGVDHERPPLASGEADVSPDDEKCFDVNKGITGSTGVDGLSPDATCSWFPMSISRAPMAMCAL